MELIDEIDQVEVRAMQPLAESEQFAIYAVGEETYLLVQRHAGTPWTGVTFSGDGLFRVASLMVDAMRHVYRDLASNLSPNRKSDE